MAQKYAKLDREKVESVQRRASLEQELVNMHISESEKERYREKYQEAEDDARRDLKKRLKIEDFEALSIIGRGAFGEVRLVRMKDRHAREVNYSVGMDRLFIGCWTDYLVDCLIGCLE